MIEFLWARLVEIGSDLGSFLRTSYDPLWDTLDIAVVFLCVYWLALLIQGTRAVQILFGLIALVAAKLMADLLNLITFGWILDNFLAWGVLIIIILFQADLRRALARVGGGVFPRAAERRESRVLEEIVRAAQTLAQKRVGALMVLEREIGLEDLIESGTPLDSVVSKELLISVFLPYSPLHDGAVVIQGDRIVHAGCILPLTLRTDLPEGVGTRHRAAVGITEESDAVVIVVSEETAAISMVRGGQLTHDLDAPRLRQVLRDIFVGGGVLSEEEGEEAAPEETPAESAPADARTAS